MFFTYAVRLRRPACSANIFHSGKVTVTGNKCYDDCRLAARKLVKMVRNLALKHSDIVNKHFEKWSPDQMKLRNFRIVNVWATTQLPWNVKLMKFAENNKDCSYEPELSATITYHITEPKCCVKIFSSGSLVIQASKIESIQGAITFIYPKAYPCQKSRKKAKVKDDDQPKDKDKMWRAHGGYGCKPRKPKPKSV